MDDSQEQDHYEERLKEVFNSFDASGSGSLCPEELSELCQSLQLDDATPTLLRTLLQNQDHLTARVSLLLCHWNSKAVFSSPLPWKGVFTKIRFYFLRACEFECWTRMCVRSSASFERDRCLCWPTPALSPLCVRAFWCFVSHLVKEPMSPYQPWSQVSVVTTTKPTNHYSKMHFFKGSPCGNVWNQTLVVIPTCTVWFSRMNYTVLASDGRMKFKLQTAPHFCIESHLWWSVCTDGRLLSCVGGGKC